MAQIFGNPNCRYSNKRARRESYQTAIDELRARLPQIEEDAATLFFREIGAVFNGSAVAR